MFWSGLSNLRACHRIESCIIVQLDLNLIFESNAKCPYCSITFYAEDFYYKHALYTHVNHQQYWVDLEAILSLQETWLLWNCVFVNGSCIGLLVECSLKFILWFSVAIVSSSFFCSLVSCSKSPTISRSPTTPDCSIPEDSDILKIFHLKLTFAPSHWYFKPLRVGQERRELFFQRFLKGCLSRNN